MKVGWLALMGGVLSDSLGRVSRTQLHAKAQGRDLSCPMDGYRAALSHLIRRELTQAGAEFRRFASSRPDQHAPAGSIASARALADACDAWSKGAEAPVPSSGGDAARVEAWAVHVLGRWPDSARLRPESRNDPLGTLLLALAERDAAGVLAASLADGLFEPDHVEKTAELTREFFDPVLTQILAKAHFFLAEDLLARKNDKGIASSDAAAFSGLLAADWQGMRALVNGSGGTPLQMYEGLLPGSDPSVLIRLEEQQGNDEGALLTRARIRGFGMHDGTHAIPLYKELLGRTKKAGQRRVLLEDLANLYLVLGEFEEAAQAHADAAKLSPEDPATVLGLACSRLGANGYTDYLETSLLYENLTAQDGLLGEYRFLIPLSTEARLFVWLYRPITPNPVRPK